MATTQSPAVSRIFGGDLQSPEEVQTAQDNALQQSAEATYQIKDPSQRVGAQAGLLVGLLAKNITGYQPPEVKQAQAIQDAFDQVDQTFKPDPKALPAENEANRLESLRQATGHLLNPAQRLQLSGQIAALRSDAFNQSRLVAGDTREQGKYETEQKAAQVKLQNDELTLKQKQRVQDMGLAANQWVFKMPDGSTKMAGQNGNDYWQLMDLANDPNSGVEVMGDFLSMQKAANAQKLAETRALGARKPLKITGPQAEKFDALGQMATYIQYLSTPAGQIGMARAGGLKNVWDRLQESIAGIPVVNVAAGYLGIDGDTPSTTANVVYGKLRVAAQALIKGVPSNNDQYILDLTNLKPSNAPAVNAARFAAITADTKQRVRTAYADWLNQVEQNGIPQPVPAALSAAIAALNIDVSDVTSIEEEQKKLNELRKQNDPIVLEMNRAGSFDKGYTPLGDYGAPRRDRSAPGSAITTKSGATIE